MNSRSTDCEADALTTTPSRRWMDRLRKFAPTLHLLQKAPPSLKRNIIEKSSTEFIRCPCDCSYNILKGNVQISPSNKLSKHKTKLRQLSNKKVSLKKKRKIVQTGGFLSVLLNTLAPVLGGVLGTFTH